jgi:hypothetical protein
MLWRNVVERLVGEGSYCHCQLTLQMSHAADAAASPRSKS